MNDKLALLEQAAKSPLGSPLLKDDPVVQEHFLKNVGPLIGGPEPAEGPNAIHAYKSDPPHESHFHPIAAPELLSEPPEAVDWVLDEYLPAGGLVLLVAKPKEGKSTLGYEAVVKIARGEMFLGRQTNEGNVLIVAVEEHQRVVRMRLRNLGASSLDGVYVHVGPLDPTATTLNLMATFAHAHCVKLILIDTLSSFWRIENENDAPK